MRHDRRLGRLSIATAVLIGTMVAATTAPGTPASALATVAVTSTSDAPWDGTPNQCRSTELPGNPCTFRASFEMIAAQAPIDWDDVVVDLTALPPGSTIETASELVIPALPSQAIELRGSSVASRRVIIQAVGAPHRLFSYSSTASNTLTITGLALRGGEADEGAALYASGSGVVLRNVEASNNTATTNGGAFSVGGWNLTIEDSAIFANTAGGDGGGLYGVATTLSMTRTSVFDNTAAGTGGGTWISPRVSSSPTIGQSAFRNNLAVGEGSALFCGSCTSQVNSLVLVDTSVVTSRGPSTAVYTNGDINATNLTVADNAGGGLRAVVGFLTSATIARNTGVSLTAVGDPPFTGFTAMNSVIDGSCVGPPVQFGFGAVLARAACPTSGTGTVISAFTVGPVAELGGVRTGDGRELPVAQTDQFDNGACATVTDARGAVRPTIGCDLGAVESNAGAPPLSLDVTSAADTQDKITGDGVCADADGACTLRAAVMEAEAFPSQDSILLALAGTLALDPPTDVYTCSLGSDSARCGDLDTTFLTISGGNIPFTRVSAPYRVFEARGNLTLNQFSLDAIGGGGETAGGLVYADIAPGQTVTLNDMVVSRGQAGSDGGGVYATGTGNLVLNRVTFASNVAGEAGGALFVTGDVNVQATRLHVIANSAASGGAIAIDGDSTVRLDNSLIDQNSATSAGGGLWCACTDVELRQVTFAGNDAPVGGAIATGEVAVSPVDALRMVNVSVLANDTINGGAVHVGSASPGSSGVSVSLSHTTINANTSDGNVVAGLEVEPDIGPAAVTVLASVISGNFTESPSVSADCVGDVVNGGASFATSTGCTVASGPPFDGADPQLGPITDVAVPYTGSFWNEIGLVPVVTPALTSPVVDAVTCAPSIAVDVAGSARPVGAACDAGSVEAIGVAMRLFASSAAPTAAGSVVPLDKLPPSAVKSAELPTGGPAPTVDGQAVRSIDLQQSPIGRISLGELPIGRIALADSPIGRIPLSSIPVGTDGGWDTILAGTELANIPLQNVTFGELLELHLPAVDALELGQLDLSATPIGRIPLGSIAYGNVPLSDLPLPDGLTWCGVIEPNLPDPAAQQCGPGTTLDPADANTTLMSISLAGVPIGRIPIGRIPIGRIDLADTPIGRIALAETDLAASPIGRIPIGRIDLADTPIGRIPLADVPIGRIPIGRIPIGRIDLAASPIGRIPIGRIDLATSPIGRIPIGRIDLTDTPIGRIPIGRIDLADTPIGRIPIGRIDLATSPIGRIPIGRIPIGRIAGIVDCSLVDCATATLAQAAAAQALVAGATLAQLGVYDDLVLADLGVYGDATLADLVGLFDLDPADVATLAQLGDYGDAVLGDFEDLIDVLVEIFGTETLTTLAAGEFGDLIGWELFDQMLTTMTIADFVALLPPDLVELLTLGSLLQGVVEPGDYPWEDLDLAAAADELAGTGGVVTYVAEITSSLQNPTDYQVSIELPSGFRYVEGSLSYAGAIRSAIPAADRGSVDAVLEPRDGSTQVTLQALVPFAIGDAGRAAASLTTTSAGEPITIQASGVDQVVAEAFEINDTADVATPIVPDTLYLTHVGTATDVDWFSIDVDQGDRMSVIISNLDADLDVVLFGPAHDPLRGAPQGSIVPAADGGRSLLAQGTVPAVVPLDDLDTTPPPGGTVIAVSTNRGTTDERIESTPLDAGRYWIRVTGYQGASNTQPYALRASLTAARFSGDCPAIVRTRPAVLPANRTALPAGATTLFVVDSARLATVYPTSTVEGAVDGPDVLDALDTLTAAVNAPAGGDGVDSFGTEVTAVLDLASLIGVQSADAAWDADPCSPAAANAVVTAIGAAIDATTAQRPSIAHVVLVGNDDQIPFARLRDATVYSNEREYAPELGDSQSPLTAALALGYLLSDDPYADAHPLSVGPRELFLPTIAIGRLVEKPAEIKTAIDNYVRFHGELDPTTALSTGYDFLMDGADAVGDALEANGLATDVDLIGDDWTAAQLTASINGLPDIVSLNAHFDHYRALPADQDARGVQDDLFTLDDITGDTAAALDGTVLFSMGCHAGLSVSDITVSGLRQADWAQTLTGAGAVFAGNTGYGYGDDTVVGATEDVMRRFAVNLDGTLTVGQAMAQAKQQYIGATAVVTPFDEKVVSQVVMYGMPQLRIGDGTPEEPPVNPPLVVDPDTQLDAAGVDLTGTVGQAGSEFEVVSTDRGSYYSYNGDTLATAGQPIQPRAIVDLTQPGRDLRGVLLTGLTSTDLAAPNPVYFTPTVDLAATSAEVPAAANTFPTALQSVSRYDSITGPRDQVILIPGQFLWDPGTGPTGGRQRLYTSIAGDAFYAPTSGPAAADDMAPSIIRSTVVIDGPLLSARVEVTDASAIALVTVLYTSAVTPGTWTELRLAPLDDGTFGVDVPVPAGFGPIDFFTQAVDAGGNVARSSNKGTFFGSVPVAAPRITTAGPQDASGWYTGPVEVGATPLVAGDTVTVSLNGDPASAPFTLTDDGAFDVAASTPNGPTERTIVRIDTAGPTVDATRSPAALRVIGPVDVTLFATDAGIGVATVTYRTTGAEDSGPITVDAATATLRVSAVGETIITARAIDLLGHEGPAVEVRLTIDPLPDVDVDAPAVECGPGPSTWQAADVSIGCTATDTGGGLADPAQAQFQLTTNVAAGTAAADATTGSVDVCDVSGNCTTVGPFGPFLVDRAPPKVDVRYPLNGGTLYVKDNVLGDVGCDDAGSGVASCTIGAIDTATIGTKSVNATARDAVGNATTITVTYKVVYLWGGFYLPFREPPQVNLGVKGQTYPVVFNVLDGRGRRILTRSAITAIQSVPRTCGTSVFGTPVTQSLNGLSDALLFWRYAWKTPTKAGCYQFRVLLNDGTTHVADFRLL